MPIWNKKQQFYAYINELCKMRERLLHNGRALRITRRLKKSQATSSSARPLADIIPKMTQMRKLTTLFLLLTLVSCGSYTMSTFYVKNTSNKPISFDASVMKFSQNGPYDINQSFTIKSNDSVMTRKVSMRNDVSPEKWFTRFNIFQTDSLEFNDPKIPQNWVKTIGKDGKPIYTFNIVK